MTDLRAGDDRTSTYTRTQRTHVCSGRTLDQILVLSAARLQDVPGEVVAGFEVAGAERLTRLYNTSASITRHPIRMGGCSPSTKAPLPRQLHGRARRIGTAPMERATG